MKNKYLILNEILGEHFGYPDCCITDFVTRRKEDKPIPEIILNNLRFAGSGFIPCLVCYEKMKNLNKRDIMLRMKRDIHTNHTAFDFLKITYTKQFVTSSKLKNFPIQEYRDLLINKIKK